MVNLIIRLLLTAVVIFVGAKYIPDVSVTDYKSALIATVVLTLLNTFVKPIIKLFTFPITFFTLGLFLLVINAMMLFATDYFVDGFQITSLKMGFIFSLVISFSSFVLSKFLDEDDD
jgi:putative membrane protein